jgi:antibiotic biosynthesis monooxygenase (ABM) superfamily enzyme
MTQTTAKNEAIVALVTKIENANGTNIVNITNGLVQVMMEGAKFPGFWSGEIIPPEDTTHHVWKLVQRFKSADQARAWQAAPSRVKLVQSITSADNSSSVEASDEIAEHLPDADVATAIATEVKPEMQDVYFAWEAKIQSAQARFPGYRGSYLQPPAPGRPGRWSTLLRFDAPESLERWFASPERQALLKEASELVSATHFQDVSNSFPGWFPVDKETGQGPPNWKTSMLVLLGLFPVVMLEIRFLSPLMTALNPALSSFLNLVLSVILTTWGTMPLFITWFTWWLLPKEKDASNTNLKGTLIMVALFVSEVAVLWNLLAPRP